MPKYGKRSLENLNSCDPKLQELFNEVIKHVDCSIICGHRGEEAQNKAFNEGHSKLKFPDSKHNKKPSKAVDSPPYFKVKPHIRWNDKEAFCLFAGKVLGIAAMMGIKIRWGGNWDGDDELHDQTFFDGPHFELID